MKIARFLLWTVLVAVVVHVGVLYATPYLIMWWIGHGLTKQGGINAIVHAPRATADARHVVKPSPDLLYSVCGYDLSGGPLRIVSAVPQGPSLMPPTKPPSKPFGLGLSLLTRLPNLPNAACVIIIA